MTRLISTTSILLATIATTIFAQNNAPSCGPNNKCPSDTPCCSQYGQCGVGAYCLGGCDPKYSFGLDSCVPAPVCRSGTYNFDNLNRIVPNTKYLGDSSKADWVSSGQPVSYNNQLWLTMAEGTVGTLLASTTHMWYGKINARFQTSAGAGVVTAFILLGDSKDEIDFEFVGVELNSAQTNFYSQGVTNYENGGNTTGLTDVHANFHDYEIDWTPDQVTWSIDGKEVRSLKREDTWNATANRYFYPQTPCRVQLSLWPAGLSSNGEGTITWGGGLVDWNSQYMVNGYYYAAFDSVSMDCYDPPSGANNQGSKSYIYTDDAMTNSSVEITNKPTVLKSLLGTGTNMSADYASSGSGAKSTEVATIPGLTGAGPGTNGQRGDNGTSSSSSSSGNTGSSSSSGDDSGSGTSSSGASATTGFVQGDGGSSGASPIGGTGEKALQGSLLAVVVAIVGLCVL